MISLDKRCFVIIPFAVEFRYLDLFLKQYLEQQHKVLCYRANTEEYQDKPIIEQINDYIREADFIIADLSSNNPNVFYELGLAHMQGKRVILIRNSGDMSKFPLPFDIQHLPVISYEDEETFLKRLDIALETILYKRYDDLHNRAREVFAEFKQSTQLNVNLISREQFRMFLRNTEQNEPLPDIMSDTPDAIARFVLLSSLEERDNAEILKTVHDWLQQRYG